MVRLDRRRESHGKRSAVGPRIQDRDGGGSGRTAERTPQPAGNAELLVAALVARAVDEVQAGFQAAEREAAARVGGDLLQHGARERRVEQRVELGRRAVGLGQAVVRVDEPRAVQRGRSDGIGREARPQLARRQRWGLGE